MKYKKYVADVHHWMLIYQLKADLVNHLDKEIMKMLVGTMLWSEVSTFDSGAWFTCYWNQFPISETGNMNFNTT